MVEINNQRKAPRYAGVVEELITDVRKPKSWLWRHCRWEPFTDYSDHPRKLVTLNPKPKSTGAGRYQLLSRWWDAYRKRSLAWKTSPKVRTLWHCSRLRSVALYLWLIVVISVRQSTVAAISGLHSLGAGYGCLSIRLTAWLQNSKKRAERSERLMYEQSHRDYLRSGYRIIVCLSWAVNHYRDNAITYKAQSATKMPENWSWRTRQLLTCRCVSKMLAARCKIHEGVSWC